MTEATILLNNTNAQALSNRDPSQISELQIKLANFKQAEMPAQKDRVNNMVTLSVQLYGEKKILIFKINLIRGSHSLNNTIINKTMVVIFLQFPLY